MDGLFVLALIISMPLNAETRRRTSSEVSSAINLICPPCDRIYCYPRRAKNLKCPGGLSRGVCNCCPVCAKQLNDPCGGHLNFMGTCDQGLICQLPPGVKVTDSNPQGRCVAEPAISLTGEQNDQGWSAACRPKCTPAFCKESPKAICSAVDNNEMKQHCQGDCQHTSCRSCRFLPPTPACPKCAQDDFRCIRDFGKCIKSDYCRKDKYPCRKTEDDPEGKFQCVVPGCLDTS